MRIQLKSASALREMDVDMEQAAELLQGIPDTILPEIGSPWDIDGRYSLAQTMFSNEVGAHGSYDPNRRLYWEFE